jgi:hypothetical protein
MISLFFANTSHAGQKQLTVFTFDGVDDLPRAQNSSFGGDSESLLLLNVGQAPQYFLHICLFSKVSSTALVSSSVFMVMFTTK